MKYLILSTLLLLCLNSFGQEQFAAIESPEYNLLYRGYPNRLSIAVSNSAGKEIKIAGTNASWKKIENLDQYIVKPGDGHETTLHVLLVDENEVDTVKSIRYRVADLPDPSIYWGGFRENGKGNIKGSNLFAKYPPEIPLNAMFRIVKWTIIHENDTIVGAGSNLKRAEDFLKSLNEGTTINFRIDFVGTDGIRKFRNVFWNVLPWDEEIDKNPKVFKCG